MSVALRQAVSVTEHSLRGAIAHRGESLTGSIGITSKLPVEQRTALEQLLFFNVNQHRVRLGIQQSIETYGVPEIYQQDGGLRVRVGDIAGVQTLFAVSDVANFWGSRFSCDPRMNVLRCCILAWNLASARLPR